MKERIWVMTGNITEFNHYARLLRDEYDLIYISEPYRLYGHRGEKFIRVGTWYEKRVREIDEILITTSTLQMIEVTYEIIKRIETIEKERKQWSIDRENWNAIAVEFIEKHEFTV